MTDARTDETCTPKLFLPSASASALQTQKWATFFMNNLKPGLIQACDCNGFCWPRSRISSLRHNNIANI